MFSTKLPILFALGFLLSVALGHTQTQQFPKSIEQKVDSLFQDFSNQAGGIIGIYKDGEVLLQKGYGYANLEDSMLVTPQTVYEIGDLSMHITAACMLLLEDQGKLSLDDPIRTYLPDLPIYKKGNPTIRHCLHHTSGIRDYLGLRNMADTPASSAFSEEEGITLLKRQKALTIAPGSDYRYSRSGYLLLAHVIRKISGKSIHDFANEHIFEPLGMENTYIYDDVNKQSRQKAIGYTYQEETHTIDDRKNYLAVGDAGVHTTMEDFLKWMANFKANRLQVNDFAERMFTRGKLNNGSPMSYALGLEHSSFGAVDFVAHNGYWGSFTAMFLEYPDHELSIAVFSNNGNISAPTKAYRASTLFLKSEYAKRKAEANAAVSSITYNNFSRSELEAFCGEYFNYDFGYARKVYIENDTLIFFNADYPPARLIPVSKNRFSLPQPGNHISFDTNEEGEKRMYFQGGERPPMEFHPFQPKSYTNEELREYEGTYYSPEIDIQYHIQHKDNSLKLYLNQKELFTFNPLMKDVFNSAHNGYLQFERDASGKLVGLVFCDYWLGQVVFALVS